MSNSSFKQFTMKVPSREEMVGDVNIFHGNRPVELEYIVTLREGSGADDSDWVLATIYEPGTQRAKVGCVKAVLLGVDRAKAEIMNIPTSQIHSVLSQKAEETARKIVSAKRFNMGNQETIYITGNDLR